MGISSLESALWDSKYASFILLVTVNALLQFLSCFCKLCFCKCVSSPFFNLFLVNVILLVQLYARIATTIVFYAMLLLFTLLVHHCLALYLVPHCGVLSSVFVIDFTFVRLKTSL